MTALSGDIDVHRVTHERAGRGTLLPSRRRTLSTARLIAGPVAGLVLPVLLTVVVAQIRGTLNLTSEALLFLLAVVGVACIGGVASAVIASVTASLLLNYWFIPPLGQFALDDPNALLALAVFAVVAAVVDRSLRLSRRSARATAEAETMSSLAGSIVRGQATIPALLERTREAFGMESADLVDQPPDAAGVKAVPAGSGAYLALHGRTLSSSERRVLAAFAAHVGSAVERTRLAEAAAEVEPVKAADRMRTALLRAVGHDLRTPLAAGWAAVTSLRSRDVEFPAEDRDELLVTADESMAKLNRLLENLLDLSRLEAGALKLDLRPTFLEEVLPMALADIDGVDMADVEDIPEVLADPPLLERVIANLAGNADRHTPPGKKVLVTAGVLAGRVELRVVDRGPGLPVDSRDRLFEPFQRLGDHGRIGERLGLGRVPEPPHRERSLVIIPVSALSRLTSEALSAASSLGDEVRAVTVCCPDPEDRAVLHALERSWAAWDPGVPLIGLACERRSLGRPIAAYVRELAATEPGTRVTVLIPETEPEHLWQRLLQNQRGAVVAHAVRRETDAVICRLRFRLL